MFTFLMIFASALGTDPDIVFAEADARWTTQVDNGATASKWFSKADSADDDQTTIFRGQTVVDPSYDLPHQVPSGSCCQNPHVQEFMLAMNPFVPAPVETIPGYYDPFGFQMGTGSFGPQGYRLGWVSYDDITVLPSSAARGTTGSMQITEWNSYIKYAQEIAPGVIFNGTGWFNARWWEGPTGVPVPGQVDQISTDLELGFFNDGPWSGQIAFHPQIVETYEAKLDRNAFNFDGRAIATYKASPQWSFVGGFQIWDRVDTMFIPSGGFIWTPNNRWEFRILFPKSRISYFLGRWYDGDVWLYGQAEYTAEAWQSYDKESGISDRIQMTDDRITGGVRWDTGRYSFFVEGGAVLNRQIKFAYSNPSFDLNDGGLIRVGLRY